MKYFYKTYYYVKFLIYYLQQDSVRRLFIRERGITAQDRRNRRVNTHRIRIKNYVERYFKEAKTIEELEQNNIFIESTPSYKILDFIKRKHKEKLSTVTKEVIDVPKHDSTIKIENKKIHIESIKNAIK